MIWVSLVASPLVIALTGYMTIRAWRSSPESWRALNQRLRPASWQRWPVYGALWRDFDRHTLRYLWVARLVAPLGVALAAFGFIALATECFHIG